MCVTGFGERFMSGLERAIGNGSAMDLASCLPYKRRSTYLGVEVFLIGSRIRVTDYSPFRGLRGTIRAVHMIDFDLEEPFCFYLVALEGVHIKEPVWFEYNEVELVAPPHVES
jgi:hypothetical protein